MRKCKTLFSSICIALVFMLSACGVLPAASVSDSSLVSTGSMISSSEASHQHSYTGVETLPTCTEQGYTTYSCSCGDSYIDDYVNATGKHSYVNGECTQCEGAEPVFTIADGYVYFGEYPQTLKASDITISETKNTKGYYLGSDNAWYEKVTATPALTTYKFNNDEIIVDQEVYYFKVEPIKWQILSNDGDSLKVVCASVLVNKPFGNIDNNYKNSTIRSWLNNEFYNTAFSTLQQGVVLTTTVDNSKASTAYIYNGYTCANTEDKIYLLSYAEAYAITTSPEASELRTKVATDYARALGVSIQTNENYGCASWWLRSPHDPEIYSQFRHSNNVLYVNPLGSVSSSRYSSFTANVGWTAAGVVPALQIKVA